MQAKSPFSQGPKRCAIRMSVLWWGHGPDNRTGTGQPALGSLPQPFVSHRLTMYPSGESNVFLIKSFCFQCELPTNPPDTDFYLVTRQTLVSIGIFLFSAPLSNYVKKNKTKQSKNKPTLQLVEQNRPEKSMRRASFFFLIVIEVQELKYVSWRNQTPIWTTITGYFWPQKSHWNK